jgi:hypothetical protein
MQDNHHSAASAPKRPPWNKGKLIGAKPPLRSKHVWSIRTKLQVEARTRDLAMFNLAIDSKLRGCDVVALKVADIAPGGYAVDRATVRQKKTGRPVRFELTEQTRQAVDDYFKIAGKTPGEFLFTGRRGRDRSITTRQYDRFGRHGAERHVISAPVLHSVLRNNPCGLFGVAQVLELGGKCSCRLEASERVPANQAAFIGAPRSMKMGTIRSPSPYDAGACVTPRKPELRRPTIPHYAPTLPHPGDHRESGSGPRRYAIRPGERIRGRVMNRRSSFLRAKTRYVRVVSHGIGTLEHRAARPNPFHPTLEQGVDRLCSSRASTGH